MNFQKTFLQDAKSGGRDAHPYPENRPVRARLCGSHAIRESELASHCEIEKIELKRRRRIDRFCWK
jgi:hypothetical protein